MTESGARINRQLKERLPCPEQLPQRLFVSRTPTRATLLPDLAAQGGAPAGKFAAGQLRPGNREPDAANALDRRARGFRRRRSRPAAPPHRALAGCDAARPGPARSRLRQTAPALVGHRGGRRPSRASRRESACPGLPEHRGAGQFDSSLGRVDPQPDPPRPRADPHRDRRGEIERLHAAGRAHRAELFARAQCFAPLCRKLSNDSRKARERSIVTKASGCSRDPAISGGLDGGSATNRSRGGHEIAVRQMSARPPTANTLTSKWPSPANQSPLSMTWAGAQVAETGFGSSSSPVPSLRRRLWLPANYTRKLSL